MLELPSRPASIRQLPLSPHAARIRAPHGERDQQRGSTANMAGPFSPRPPPSVQNVPAQALSPRTVLPTPRSAALWSSHIPSRSLSPGREGSPSREDMPHDYDQMCVRPWKGTVDAGFPCTCFQKTCTCFSDVALIHSLRDAQKGLNTRFSVNTSTERAPPSLVPCYLLMTQKNLQITDDILPAWREPSLFKSSSHHRFFES
jgi:hypothetical protein